jgi:hypothetical protein
LWVVNVVAGRVTNGRMEEWNERGREREDEAAGTCRREVYNYK